MGLTIYYSGRLRDAATLENLIQEVEDACRAHNWNSFVFNREFPNHRFSTKTELDKVYGISFSPKDCEPVCIAFLSNGRMVLPFIIDLWAYSEKEDERNFIYSLFTKTQFAGYQTHKKIILLLKYLNEKYFEDFEMNDETEYWDTGDEAKLIATFKRYDALLDNFSLAFDTLPPGENEDLLNYIERIADRVQGLEDNPENEE